MKARVRMALAEAGYPHAEVVGPAEDPSVTLDGPRGVPSQVCWRAFSVAGCASTPCWQCWMGSYFQDCAALGLGVWDCGRVREAADDT